MDTAVKIITNNQPRELLYFHDLTDKEQREFSDIDDFYHNRYDYVRYKGEVYCLKEFMVGSQIGDWDGVHQDTFFSGILFKFTDDGEAVIMGRYYS